MASGTLKIEGDTLSLMFEHVCPLRIASSVGNPLFIKIIKHALVGFRTMLHHMIVGHTIKIKVLDVIQMLWADDELLCFQSHIARLVSTMPVSK